jgi:hypothetical protein
MNAFALPILLAILKTGIVLSLSAVAVATFLRVFRVSSPTVRRTAYVAVLLQGWLVFEGPFALPLPAFVSKAVDWPALADRLLEIRDLRVALAARPPVFDRRPTRADTGLRRTHWNGYPQSSRGQTASVFDSSSTVGPDRQDRDHRAIQELSTLATDGKPTPIASQKSTGGPKLPPVAPEQGPIESVTASVDLPPSHEQAFPWPLALASLWGTGILLIAGRSAWAYVRFVRRFPASGETPPEWADEWTSLQLDAGLPGTVPLVVAEHVGPVLCRLPSGYRLIVPGEAWRTLDPSQRLLILRHELAHIERRDVWKSLAMRILALPHWFNPLAWHIVRQFDECAEWACDEAAAGSDPEYVPSYARALLQLGHRVQPAFFAAPAARTQGLAHRIRRLVTPETKKGIKMKMTFMATLLLGLSLLNVARLQTRAEGNPSAIDDQGQSPRATPMAADKPAATKPQTKKQRRPITVQAPVKKSFLIPVTEAELVETQVLAEPTSDAPSPVTQPVAEPSSEPAGIVASASVSTETDSKVPSSVDAETPAAAIPATVRSAKLDPTPVPSTVQVLDTKTIQPSVVRTIPLSIKTGLIAEVPAKTARTTQVMTNSALPNGDNVIGTTSNVEVQFLGNVVAESTAVGSALREARVNLPYILEHMDRYQRDKAELKASHLEMEKWQVSELAHIATVKERLNQEKDPLVRTYLKKGVNQSDLEVQRKGQEWRDTLVRTEKEIHQQNLQRVIEEIARFAKEHKFHVVRRMPYPREKRTGAVVVPPPISPNGTTYTWGVSPGGFHFLAAPAEGTMRPGPMADGPGPGATVAQLTNSSVNTATLPEAGATTQARPDASLSYPPEILYVAEVRGEQSPDISDEIVQRLNAAKGKTSNSTAK